MAGPVPLNWKEISLLVESIREKALGPRGVESFVHVDRVVVPERSRFPEGSLKSDWVIRLTSRKKELSIGFSVRARNAYLLFYGDKGPKAATQATHSPFSLHLASHVKGIRLLDIEALPRERIVVFWFSPERQNGKARGLVLTMIPTSPEALWVEKDSATRWRVLARSKADRGLRDSAAGEDAAVFNVPGENPNAPADPPVRPEIARGAEVFTRVREVELDREAYELRLARAERAIKEMLKHASDRERQSASAAAEAEREPDWRRYGDLLKNALAHPDDPPRRTQAPARKGPGQVLYWEVADSFGEAGARALLPADAKLSAVEQAERYYSHAKRKARRIEEGRARAEQFGERARRCERLLAQWPKLAALGAGTAGASGGAPDWAALERLEREAQITSPTGAAGAPGAAGAKSSRGGEAKRGGWLGRAYVSRDGLPIWVGKSRDENLELTFKHARGNDIWLHVRGRPGAHVVVPIQPGKSAPLETLLDAAVLCVFFSGGEKWGKTEVDYAFKKHVKRIKNSTEASYTHNKTLIVEPEPARLKRLLGSE